jgi:uncharacterized protein involved in oxidation of intracellular sulfur
VVLVVLAASPYGSDKVYAGLRLAAALIEKTDIVVFLLTDAVATAVADQSAPNEDTNLARRLEALLERGAQVKVCGLCLEQRGLHASRLVAGIQVGSMPELADLVLQADKIVPIS